MGVKQEWEKQSKGMFWMGVICIIAVPFTVGISLVGTIICWVLAAQYNNKAKAIPDDYVEPAVSQTAKPAGDCSKGHEFIPPVEIQMLPAKKVHDGSIIIKGDKPRTRGRRGHKPKALPAPPEAVEVEVKKPTVVRSKWKG